MKIKKTYLLGLRVKWILKAIVNGLNAIIWSLDNFFPDPKAEDLYTEERKNN